MQQDEKSKVTAESSAKHAHGPRPCGKKMITESFQREILGNIQNINIGKYIIKGPGHSAYAHQTYIYTLYFPIPNAVLSTSDLDN